MKNIKNNHGVTGIDVAISIIIISMVLTIVMAIYNSYGNKVKEINRNTASTNLAMSIIHKIESEDINLLSSFNKRIKFNNTDLLVKDEKSLNPDLGPTDELGENDLRERSDDIKSILGIGDTPIPGYTVEIVKRESSSETIDKIAIQIDVTVTYNVENKEHGVSLSVIKKNVFEEAYVPRVIPDIINDLKIKEEDKPLLLSSGKEIIPIKYDYNKNGYVQTTISDVEWYSISSKLYPMIVIADKSYFDRNGIINIAEASKTEYEGDTNISKSYVYMYIPYMVRINSNGNILVKFSSKNGLPISYKKDVEKNVYRYVEDSSFGASVTDSNPIGGMWQRVFINDDFDVNPCDPDSGLVINETVDNPFYILKNNFGIVIKH